MDILDSLRPGELIVITEPADFKHQAATLSAEFALRGPVTVLDGGNCFPFYRFARLVHATTHEGAIAAKRLYIRRAFTCHQMLALLESTPSLTQPYLVLNPLATFYDEQIPEYEVSRLLDECLKQMRRLHRTAPVLVILAPPKLAERAFLVARIQGQAREWVTLQAATSIPAQLALF